MAKHLVVFSAILFSLTGCATMDRSAMSYVSDVDGQHGQRVFIWKANYSAGIASHGGVCAQGALTAEANSSETQAGVNSSIITAFTGIPQAQQSSEDLAHVARSANQNVMLTNATNGQTAFANLAFFYLCQIALNSSTDNRLTGDQIVDMWKLTHEQIAQVSANSAEVQKLVVEPAQIGGNANGGSQ